MERIALPFTLNAPPFFTLGIPWSDTMLARVMVLVCVMVVARVLAIASIMSPLQSQEGHMAGAPKKGSQEVSSWCPEVTYYGFPAHIQPAGQSIHLWCHYHSIGIEPVL